MVSLHTSDGNSARKGVRQEDTGEPVFLGLARLLLSRQAFHTFLIVHRDQWVIQNYAALAAQTHQNQAFLSAYLVVYTSLR